MTQPAQQPKRGLASVHKVREERNRGKFNRPSPAMLLYATLAVVASLVLYRFVSGRQVEGAKGRLLAKQRATEQELGARWTPLRDKVEKAALRAGAAYAGDLVDPQVKGWDFRAMPGIYLRMRAADASDTASLRRAAQESARDAFVGMLLRTQPGADGGAFPDQPWNLRQAYAATRVLTPEWVQAVKDSDDELRLRVFEQQYAKAIDTEIPVAIDIVTRARFLLLVLDEDVEEARARVDGGPMTLDTLELVPHPSRVHVVDLRRDAEVLRVRRTGAAGFVMAGERAAVDAETREAMQRQVNNADLARQVKVAIDEGK